jgi:adenylylsulfate kinase-like enzyme
MHHIITIHGPLGAGKSTLTTLLREQLPTYSYVDRPYIKRGLKPAGKEQALALSKKASYMLIEELVSLGQDIIAEEVTPVSMKKHFGEEFFKKHHYTIIPFYLTCSVETAIERDLNRGKTILGEAGVRNIHENYAKPADYEIIINTEQASTQQCLQHMLTNINRNT